MATIALAIGALAAFGQFLGKPAAMDVLGLGRTVKPLNNGNCQLVPGELDVSIEVNNQTD